MDKVEVAVPAFVLAFLVSFGIIPVIIHISKKRNMLDAPGGRKIHKERIPALGGIGIGLGFIMSAMIWSPLEQIAALKFVYSAIGIMLAVGFRDDVLHLSPGQKLVGQLAAAVLVVVFADIRLTSMHGIFWINEIPVWLSYVVTIFTIIVITNAFNLIDGLDGLAGSISAIALITFGVWFSYYGNTKMDVGLVVLISALVGGIMAFLKFNISPAKIFMGDTGSLMIGFVASVVAIRFIEANTVMPAHAGMKFEAPVATTVAILIYPLYDTLRIFVLRVLKGKSPFSGDKSHIHHLIMRIGFTHIQTTSILVVSSIVMMGIVVMADFKSDSIAVLAILFLSFLIGLFLDYRLSKAFPKKTKKKAFFN